MDESSARDHYTEMLHQPWNPEVIRQAPDLEPGDEHPSVVEVQNFLKRFGYFIDAVAEGLTPERGRLDEVTVRALVDYQRFYSVGPDDGRLYAGVDGGTPMWHARCVSRTNSPLSHRLRLAPSLFLLRVR